MPSINIEVVKEQAFMGVPSKLPNICDIYPLTIKEIITMGTDVYRQRLGLLLMEEADLHNLLKEKNIRDKYIVMVGGAPVTKRWAEKIGADAYTEDAAEYTKVALQLIEQKREKASA